jgi:hypothetical protein
VIVAVAFEDVRAALQRDVDCRARGVPLLSVECRCFDLELLDRARGRHKRHPASVRHVGRAVERELVSPRAAVRGEIRGPAVVEGPGELQIAVIGDARREPRQDEGVAVGERHQRDALLVDHLTRRSRPCLEQRRVGRHGYGLLELANLHRQVDCEPVADANFDSLPDDFLEPRQLRRQSVRAWREVRNRIVSSRIRRGSRFDVRRQVGRDDRGARQPAALRVRDASGDGAAKVLGAGSGSNGQDSKKTRARARETHQPSHTSPSLTRPRDFVPRTPLRRRSRGPRRPRSAPAGRARGAPRLQQHATARIHRSRWNTLARGKLILQLSG